MGLGQRGRGPRAAPPAVPVEALLHQTMGKDLLGYQEELDELTGAPTTCTFLRFSRVFFH